MITLEELEAQYNTPFPKLYQTLFEAEMLNWFRGFELPLEKGKSWADDVYPALKENPPLLLHAGGSDFELLTPSEMLNFIFPEEWDTDAHHFIPFAKTAEGNVYAFYVNEMYEGEYPIVLIWDDDETEFIAKSFEDFIFRKMMEAADDIDKEDLEADYGKENDAIEHYRADIQADLTSIKPYLNADYVKVLEDAYNGEVLSTLISYGFKTSVPLKEIIAKMLDFEEMGNTFDHER